VRLATGGCTGVQLSRLAMSIYRRTSIDLFSSPFLASALLPPYATITNTDDTVVVAQFLGDGIAVELSNVRLCTHAHTHTHTHAHTFHTTECPAIALLTVTFLSYSRTLASWTCSCASSLSCCLRTASASPTPTSDTRPPSTPPPHSARSTYVGPCLRCGSDVYCNSESLLMGISGVCDLTCLWVTLPSLTWVPLRFCKSTS